MAYPWSVIALLVGAVGCHGEDLGSPLRPLTKAISEPVLGFQEGETSGPGRGGHAFPLRPPLSATISGSPL